ncbi:MAG: hypothetical protein P2A85_20195 [Microcoleus anatoxicus]|uniref:hypothetical protein n=1 Tax=Microcoleus anatoxicus TaxID=2705319 RepID=UPI00366EF9DC
MSFAEEMRRKSLEGQRKAAEQARAEEAKALALEESKRNNCIPILKQEIEFQASRGERKKLIKAISLCRNRWYYENMDKDSIAAEKAMIENMELDSFLEMYSSTLDEYDRMRIAFIKAEPGLSLKVEWNFFLEPAWFGEPATYSTSVTLMVVW